MPNNKLLPYFPEINYIKKHLLDLADEIFQHSPAEATKFRILASDLDDIQHKSGVHDTTHSVHAGPISIP